MNDITNENNNLQIFKNTEFGNVRTLEINGEPWFVGKDIAEILGYSNPRDAINKRVDNEDKGVAKCDTLGGIQDLTIINESGLYSLILSSRLPKAKEFKRWVTSEVIPSIRKHGAYMTPDKLEELMSNPDSWITMITTLKEERAKNLALSNENKVLTETNNNLATVNGEYTRQQSKWNDRQVLNALIRSYAYTCCSNRIGHVWDKFYKEIKYKLSIDVKLRHAKDTSHPNCSLLDYIKPEEWHKVVKVAIAMCENEGINVGKVINKVNANGYSECS